METVFLKYILEYVDDAFQGGSVLTIVLLIYIVYSKLKQRFRLFEDMKEKLDDIEEKLDKA